MKQHAVYTYRTVPYCGTVFLKIALKTCKSSEVATLNTNQIFLRTSHVRHTNYTNRRYKNQVLCAN